MKFEIYCSKCWSVLGITREVEPEQVATLEKEVQSYTCSLGHNYWKALRAVKEEGGGK